MKERGFSLSEALIALMLMTSISLALLKQQWQITRLRIQIVQQAQHFLKKSNAKEKGCTYLNQCGMSLLELMIALVLSLSMITLLMQEYMQVQQHYQFTEKTMNEIAQEQWALDFIRDQGHQAGFTSCMPLRYLITKDHRQDRTIKALELDPKKPSKITFSYMHGSYLVDAVEDNQRLYINKSAILRPNYPVIIADCHHAEVYKSFRARPHKNSWVIEFPHALTFIYHAPIYVGEWVEHSFWIGASKTQQSSVLFYHYHLHTDELISNVKFLEWRLEKYQNHTMLHLNMAFNKEKAIPLDIRMYHL